MMSEESEEIRRAQGGDRQAFGALVRRYQRRVYATAFRVVGNHSDADDLMQEAFLRALRALSGFDGRSDFFTWLYRIVVNLALNHLRRAGRRRAAPLEEGRLPPGWDHPGTDPRRQAEAKDLFRRVSAAIDDLPPIFKLTVVLGVIEEIPYKQVASMLGCSEGTIAWRVNQARKMLRQRLAPLEPAAPAEARAEDETDAASDAAAPAGRSREARVAGASPSVDGAAVVGWWPWRGRRRRAWGPWRPVWGAA